MRRSAFESPIQSKRKYASLIRMMYDKCPQEIVNRIRDTPFVTFFCNGFVKPQRHMKHEPQHVYNKKSSLVARPALLNSFGKLVHAEIQIRFRKDNTLVIGEGEPSYTTDFLRYLLDAAHDHINKIDMAFTLQDLGPVAGKNSCLAAVSLSKDVSKNPPSKLSRTPPSNLRTDP